MTDAYRAMQQRATPANLFLSSVRLHFVEDQRAWEYFQDVQFKYGYVTTRHAACAPLLTSTLDLVPRYSTSFTSLLPAI